MTTQVFTGDSLVKSRKKKVQGEFTTIEGDVFYKISHYDQMDDFFMTLNSPSDHWMFISSNGSLTAGRKDRDNALFPYYTVDKIHDYRSKTGSLSHFLINRQGKQYLWSPFSAEIPEVYEITRNIYKNAQGNALIFEEINEDLKLQFCYSWRNSNTFGFVRKSWIINHGTKDCGLSVLDGITNILPSGVSYAFQNEFSNLLDAYKRSERVEKSNLGLFTLSAIPVDRAEPSESLYCNSVFSLGLDQPVILLSTRQLKAFQEGKSIQAEMDVKASRGAYLVHKKYTLGSGSAKSWYLVADVNKDSRDIENLNRWIQSHKDPLDTILSDIKKGSISLQKVIASVDGLQSTRTAITHIRHSSNALFNAMRGGVFAHNYVLDIKDFREYLSIANIKLAERYKSFPSENPGQITYRELIESSRETGDPDLLRLSYEYLPLFFSRRHGDPSRPWNRFSIQTHKPDGSLNLHYEGNWRDIFQNWEALAYSFPGFTEGMISRFVNASTPDGYNPYRITRKGLDWECPDPDSPWAYIGYWGDHQVIYLQKLLELSAEFNPGKLEKLLESDIFTYANVPYHIKNYDEIVSDPKNTIDFDQQKHESIMKLADKTGSDGKLVWIKGKDGPYHVTLMEKMLASLLSKLSNFIPGAGIWLNTQRPEWNDANNALVGNGTSMVTVYYLRRALAFWTEKLSEMSGKTFTISSELVGLFHILAGICNQYTQKIQDGISPSERRAFVDASGKVHEIYRNRIYSQSFSGKKDSLAGKDILRFFRQSIANLEVSIRENKRKDGLYHSYNLVKFRNGEIWIRNLYEMLEGQVAVLSSGFLSPAESLAVLDSLKESAMFRKDQYSYMLYPDRQLKGFRKKNQIPAERIENQAWLKEKINSGHQNIVNKDDSGAYHFNSDFRNAEMLSQALEKENDSVTEDQKHYLLDLYEELFDHQSFTGRSGTFYGYEGLGSIYWHMVSKLLLATQECFFRAMQVPENHEIANRLKDHYYEIKAGIGIYKSPDLYGAFPTDAYSHTPAGSGVKQPGLTGQVKEDIIARFGEMGVRVQKGCIRFDPSLLNLDELLTSESVFSYFDIEEKQKEITLEKGQIAFTFCQVPIIMHSSDTKEIRLLLSSEEKVIPGNSLNEEFSNMLFSRSGEINSIHVYTTI